MMDDNLDASDKQPEDAFERPIAPPLPRSRPWLALSMAAAVGIVGLVAQAVAIGVYISAAEASDPAFNAEAWAENAVNNGLALSIATWAGGVVATPLLFFFAGRLSGGRTLEFLGWRGARLRSLVGWVLAILAFVAGYDLLTWQVGREIAPTFMRDAYLTAGHPALLWLTLVVAAPLFEELMFRGFLFSAFVRSPLGVAGTAVVTSLMWAMLHVQYDATLITMIFVIGLLLTAARQVTGSIIPCLAMHAAMNATATLEIYYILQMEAAG